MTVFQLGADSRLVIEPVFHPNPHVHRSGFTLDHPYLESCWTPILGPTGVLLLRRCPAIWHDRVSSSVTANDLAHMLGLGNPAHRTDRHGRSTLAHTIDRLCRFHFAAWRDGEDLSLAVFTEVPQLPVRYLEGLPGWVVELHEHYAREAKARPRVAS